MTDEQREKIKELRLEGMGYKAIATSLGLSRDSVRGFCRRHGLEGDSCVISLNVQVKREHNLLCVQCEKPLKQKVKGRTRKFCSDSCRRTWWKENNDKRNKKEDAIYQFVCPYCHKEFKVYGNKCRKYCSHNCYIKDRFWREENAVQETKN